MGLDVYLYRCENRELARAAEHRAEAAMDAVWANVNSRSTALSDAERDELHDLSKAASRAEGCDDWGCHLSVEQIDLPSKLYPEHLFRIGYFRSSYNSGGINSVFHNLGLPDLYEIMQVPDSEYEVIPDWDQCLINLNAVIDRYQQHLDSEMGKFDVIELRNPIDRVESAQAALALFAEEQSRHNGNGGFSSYTSSRGDFYLDGLRVHAFIPSSNRHVSMYAIISKEKPNQEDWYMQALKIMRETCEYVLAQPDPECYYMRWSG